MQAAEELPVACSICLDQVVQNGDYSTAKLQCGHQFHLDCICSAFNAKGLMQCPNCRNVEEGKWLYANSYNCLPEVSMDEFTREEEISTLNSLELPYHSRWCPFNQFLPMPMLWENASSSNRNSGEITFQPPFSLPSTYLQFGISPLVDDSSSHPFFSHPSTIPSSDNSDFHTSPSVSDTHQVPNYFVTRRAGRNHSSNHPRQWAYIHHPFNHGQRSVTLAYIIPHQPLPFRGHIGRNQRSPMIHGNPNSANRLPSQGVSTSSVAYSLFCPFYPTPLPRRNPHDRGFNPPFRGLPPANVIWFVPSVSSPGGVNVSGQTVFLPPRQRGFQTPSSHSWPLRLPRMHRYPFI